MRTSSVSDLDAAGTGALSSKFPLLRIFSMAPLQHPTPLSSPTMPPSSRSEKLLRDALQRDERERQQLSSPLGGNNIPTTPPTHTTSTHRRRHSHAPTSSSKEDYTRGSFLFRTAMSNPRSPSPSPSSFSQGKELEQDGEDLPVRRKLFYGGDAEGNDGPQTHPQRSQGHAQLHQQSTMAYQYHPRRSSLSPSPSPSRHSSASSSPPPSPICMKRRPEGLGLTSPNIHAHTIGASPITNANMSSIGKINTTSPRYGPAYPFQPKSQYLSHGQGEPLQMTPHEHEQALRARLERALVANGGSDSSSRIMTRGRDGLKGNEVGGEQGVWPWRSGRQNIGNGSSGSGSISASFNTLITASSSASTSNSNASSSYPHTPRTQIRTHQPTYSSSSHARTRSQTDSTLHPPHPTSNSNSNSPRRNTVTPTTSPPASNTSGSGKLTRSSSKSTKKSGVMVPPLPFSLKGAGNGEKEEGLRLPTPPPTPPTPPTLPFMTRVPLGSGGAGANGYVPSPSGTPTRIPVSVQTQSAQRKKEGGLEMRRPTQGPAAAGGNKERRQLGGQRQRDVTVTQARLATTTSPNPDPKRGHSLTSTESCSTRTSVSSATSNSHVGCVSASVSGYCACSSHSSLDGPLGLPQPPFVGGVYQSQSNPSPPSSPATTGKLFNARKASTQCRAIQGYVSFASVEGLGEPPLVGDELDGFGEVDDGGKGRTGIPFLPLGAWSALGWRKFLGGGVGAGIEVSDQNAAHTRAAICVPT